MEPTKRVWVFRHGPREAGDSVISPEVSLKNPEGPELTKKVAEIFLKDQSFSKIFVSPFVRTYQTGVILSLYLGMDFPVVEPGLAPDNVQDWEKLAKKVNNSTNTLDFFNADPKLVCHDAIRVLNTICNIYKELANRQQALCVGHGGFIEPALAMALWLKTFRGLPFVPSSPSIITSYGGMLDQITPLKQGEAIIFVFDNENNKFVSYEEKRLPSPM